jgi:imidazolonepropionase-like amidohydrolase
MAKHWLTIVMAGMLVGASAPPVEPATGTATLLRPAAVFDGVDGAVHANWQVLVRGDRIVAVGPNLAVPAGAQIIDLAGDTLMPGMIEGHGHLFLHPYDEASWDDQVLHEPLALRTARAVANARATLQAGFTSERDLGTEGAGYADVGLKAAIEQGIVEGPRLSVATRAIVALGAYGPKGFEPGVAIPQGAEEVSGAEQMIAAVRRQIAAGADWIKLYADYRWRAGEDSRATLSLDEIRAAVVAAHDAGRPVAVHASTAEGMRRAIEAGGKEDRIMSDTRSRRRECTLSRLDWRGAGTCCGAREPRQPPLGARCRCSDLHGRGRWRVRARHERA